MDKYILRKWINESVMNSYHLSLNQSPGAINYLKQNKTI